MVRKRREPTIEVREHVCADGSVTEMWSVRYYDAAGARRRLRCASREEADFERARLVLAESRSEPVAASSVRAEGSGLTLAGFWPMYRADAESRLARSTSREYERIWARRLGPHFDLRHAFASLLIREQRTSIVELAEQLGHAPTMTLNTYTHVFREHRRSAPVDVGQWIRAARIAAGRVVTDACDR